MASEIDAANRALSKIGSARITSRLDNSKEAREVNAAFDIVRDAELRKNRWSFAKRRSALAASVTAPAFGYGYQYTLPTLCLRVLRVGDFSPGLDLSNGRNASLEEYAIEGRSILTDDAGPLNIIYLESVVDVTLWDAMFLEVFACKLAFEIADALTGSQSRKDACAQDYEAQVRAAVHANAIELPASPIADDSWILSRLQG